MRRFLRRNTSEFIWMLSIVSAIGIISILWYDVIDCLFNSECEVTETIYWVYGIITGFLLLYIIWVLFIKKNRILKEIWEKSFWIELFKWNNIKRTILPVFLLIVFLAVLIVLYRCYGAPVGKHLFLNPGGLFGIIMGFATVIGTYLAIKSIVEMKHTITSYPQLYEALTELINNTPSKEIRIVSYFILPGYWQVASKTKREKFKEALLRASDKIKIACITPGEHLSILIDVAKKGTRLYSSVKAEHIKEFQEECEAILSNFEKYPPVRLRWEDLPYYYFFVTEERAIIVTPVGLPKLNSTIDATKVTEISNKIKNNVNDEVINMINEQLNKLPITQQKDARVETLGFETTDQHIIDMLWGLSDKYYNSNPSSEQSRGSSNYNANNQENSQSNNNDNTVNIEVNKTKAMADILVEISNKIKVNVKVQE